MKTYAHGFATFAEAEQCQAYGRCNVCGRAFKVQERGGYWWVECMRSPRHVGVRFRSP